MADIQNELSRMIDQVAVQSIMVEPAGATIMGDGRVGLILDIHSLFEVGKGDSVRKAVA